MKEEEERRKVNEWISESNNMRIGWKAGMSEKEGGGEIKKRTKTK